MVFKRISVRKTHTGYSVSVFVKDGALVKPLYFGLEKFFAEVEKRENNQQVLEEVKT